MILGHMQTHKPDKVANALNFHRSQISAPFLNQPLDSGDKVIVIGAFQNPAVVNQDTQYAHGVGASAESEQVDFVTLGKVLNNVAVAIQIVLMSALSRDSRADAIVIGAQTRFIKTCCLGTLSLGLLARASSKRWWGNPFADPLLGDSRCHLRISRYWPLHFPCLISSGH